MVMTGTQPLDPSLLLSEFFIIRKLASESELQPSHSDAVKGIRPLSQIATEQNLKICKGAGAMALQVKLPPVVLASLRSTSLSPGYYTSGPASCWCAKCLGAAGSRLQTGAALSIWPFGFEPVDGRSLSVSTSILVNLPFK